MSLFTDVVKRAVLASERWDLDSNLAELGAVEELVGPGEKWCKTWKTAVM